MPAGCFLQARGTEGWEEDLARSTAEEVGGYEAQEVGIRIVKYFGTPMLMQEQYLRGLIDDARGLIDDGRGLIGDIFVSPDYWAFTQHTQTFGNPVIRIVGNPANPMSPEQSSVSPRGYCSSIGLVMCSSEQGEVPRPVWSPHPSSGDFSDTEFSRSFLAISRSFLAMDSGEKSQ